MVNRLYTTNELKEKLFPVFNTLPINKAILFGSYANGNPTSTSDVDILIDSNGRLRGIDFFGVLDDVVEALQVPVDLIEASQIIKGSRAEHEIKKTGIIIYERT